MLAWKQLYEQMKLEQRQRLELHQSIKQCAAERIKKERRMHNDALLASAFAEWRREGKILRYQEMYADSVQQLDEHAFHREEMQQQMQGMQEDLQMAYEQIDQMKS